MLGISSNIDDIKSVFLQLEMGIAEEFHLTVPKGKREQIMILSERLTFHTA